MPVLLADESPEVAELVGRRLRVRSEDRGEAFPEGSLVHHARDERPERGQEELLDPPCPVHLGEETAVQEADAADAQSPGAVRALLVTRDQFLRNGVAVVVREDDDLVDPESPRAAPRGCAPAP
jgi:hypothetical protein